MDRNEEIRGLLADIAMLRHTLVSQHTEAKSDLSLAQREVVRRVSKSPDGITVTELANALGISSSAVTQHLDEIEPTGWITRTKSEQDRRVTLVQMSKSGRRKADRMMEQTVERFAKLFHVLSDTELKSLSQTFNKLVEPENLKRATKNGK